MKRLAVFLLACILLLTLSACFSEEASNPNPQTPPAQNTPNEMPSNTDTPDTQQNNEHNKPSSPSMEEIPFEEIIAVDNDDCLIKIVAIEEDMIWGYSLKVYLENKTPDKTLMFSVLSASVNGIDSDPFFAQEVAPGKKSNESISFSDETLEDHIENYTDILLHFRVYDSNDWSADDVATASVHVYPYGEENATKYVRETLPTDTVLVDNEYVTVIVTDYDPDSFWGYSANLYIVNKTDTTITVSTDEVSLNGFMLDPFYATSVMPDSCKFSSISWFTSDLEDNGITEVEEIEFILKIYDAEDWTANDFAYENISLAP